MDSWWEGSFCLTEKETLVRFLCIRSNFTNVDGPAILLLTFPFSSFHLNTSVARFPLCPPFLNYPSCPRRVQCHFLHNEIWSDINIHIILWFWMGLVDCFNLLCLDDRHWDVAISVMKFQLLNDSDDQIFLSAVLGREGGQNMSFAFSQEAREWQTLARELRTERRGRERIWAAWKERLLVETVSILHSLSFHNSSVKAKQ